MGRIYKKSEGDKYVKWRNKKGKRSFRKNQSR